MAKIRTAYFRHERHSGEYEIMYYSSGSLQIFYTELAKLFPEALEYYTALKTEVSGKSVPGISEMYLKRIGLKLVIYAATESELIRLVETFHKNWVETAIEQRRVILYSLEYRTETKASDDMPSYNFYPGKLEMRFTYKIATKKQYGKVASYTTDQGGVIHEHEVRRYMEIFWTKELEESLKKFSEAFDQLIDRMRPIFETPGSISLLIGRNVIDNQ